MLLKNFIEKLEEYFKQDWNSVLNKGEEYLLSPSQIIEIFYLYYKSISKKTTRDEIMYKMSEISMVEIVNIIKKIRREVELALS